MGVDVWRGIRWNWNRRQCRGIACFTRTFAGRGVFCRLLHVVGNFSRQAIGGTVAVSLSGYESTEDTIQSALENLPRINILHDESIPNGWSVTFLSEVGDRPLMEATSGRLSGVVDAEVVITDMSKEDPAKFTFKMALIL